MAYATQADLVPRRMTAAELLQLTDDTGGGAVNAQTVTDVLTEASGTVDSYCRERYTVPLKASEQIKGITLNIAVYLLFLRRRRVAPEVQQAFADAIQFLRDVSVGKASLDQAVGALPQTVAGGAVPTQKDEKFSDDHLKGYV